MNIIQQTSTQLTFKNSNRQWLWGALFAVPFVTVGLGITLFSATVTTLECQRTKPSQINCQRTIIGLLGTETTPIPGQVTGASVVTASGVGVVLSTSKGSMPLTKHREFVLDQQRYIASNINAFIHEAQQPSFKIQQDDRWQGWLTGANFFMPGLAIIGVSLAIPIYVLCDFDKSSGLLTLEKRYRLFNTEAIDQYKLADTQQAQISQLPISNRPPIYAVTLTLISTKPISLSPPTRDRQECQTMVNTINRFLQLREV
ncbi:MAG: hypothetical protein DCF22_19130 [Leptolyngbya sp.]|nr:MAG: hypothetical protein DCF22_19130 [Leptolyngbya sp.]